MSFVDLNDNDESNTSALLLPPIGRLNRDTLWLIFDIIASAGFSTQEEPFALVTIQHSSQVCHAWRTILLSSPSIWAKVIQMELLAQRGHNWREEVMRRTGSSPLWIRAQHDSPAGFLSKLICDNWDRLERLVLVNGSETMNEDVWHCFLRPAPQLEIFTLRARYATTSLSPGMEHPIFSGNAPRLKEFRLDKLRQSNLDLRFECHIGWMSHLRALEICLSTPSMVSQFIFVAANMPLLESLQIFLVDGYGQTLEKFPPGSVTLPSLKILELYGLSYTALLFLDIISQPDTFTRIKPSIYIRDGGTTPAAIRESENITLKILSSHMASYLSANILTEIVFYFGCNGARIDHIERSSVSPSVPPSHHTIFSCRPSGVSNTHHEPTHNITLSPLFSALPSQFTKTITSLAIRPIHTPCIVRRHLGDLLLATHFASYLGLETLAVPLLLLPLFSAMPTTIKTFPALRVLKTTLVARASNAGDFERNVLGFLEWRKAVGVPIHTLDLTHHPLSPAGLSADASRDAPSLESLEVVMEGLVIMTGPMDDPRLHRVLGKGSLKDLDLR